MQIDAFGHSPHLLSDTNKGPYQNTIHSNQQLDQVFNEWTRQKCDGGPPERGMVKTWDTQTMLDQSLKLG